MGMSLGCGRSSSRPCPSCGARVSSAWLPGAILPLPEFSQAYPVLDPGCRDGKRLLHPRALGVPGVLPVSLLFGQSWGFSSAFRRQRSAGVCWHGRAPSSVAHRCSLGCVLLSLCWVLCAAPVHCFAWERLCPPWALPESSAHGAEPEHPLGTAQHRADRSRTVSFRWELWLW